MRNEGELMPKIFMFTFQRASINGSEIPFVPILRINNEMQKLKPLHYHIKSNMIFMPSHDDPSSISYQVNKLKTIKSQQIEGSLKFSSNNSCFNNNRSVSFMQVNILLTKAIKGHISRSTTIKKENISLILCHHYKINLNSFDPTLTTPLCQLESTSKLPYSRSCHLYHID